MVSLLPSTATTLPLPNFWWNTRSPTRKSETVPVDLATSSPSMVSGGREWPLRRLAHNPPRQIRRSRGALRARARPARAASRASVARAEGLHVVEARGAVAAHAEAAPLALRHLDMRPPAVRRGSARERGRPHAVDAPVGGEIDLRALARAREADMGEPALFLEPGAALSSSER